MFNIAINYPYEEICDPQFVDEYGFNLSNDYNALGLSGFANYQAIAGKNEICAIRLIETVEGLFSDNRTATLN